MTPGRAFRAGAAGSLVLVVAACARERQSAPAAAEPSPAQSAAPKAVAGPETQAAPKAAPVVSSRGQPSPPPALPESLRTDVNTMDESTAFAALSATSRSFEDGFAASSPDCPTGRVLAERICALAVRICHLADEAPSRSEVRAHCADGNGRCGAARRRITSACD
ncbi:MAG TPA: hypothetical protein VHU80_01530 [Polyangiaceae bacterium]|jgi:hypothetical protein|nr:hypothetical protein [Polyangiaceae bacterium]